MFTLYLLCNPIGLFEQGKRSGVIRFGLVETYQTFSK
jgi:hypothetical protein